MALTQGFKNLLKAVAIIAVVGGGGTFVHKKNYFGLMDEKPVAAQVKAIEQPDPNAAVLQEESAGVEIKPGNIEPTPKRRRIEIPVTEPEPETAPAPTPSNDPALNKLKGLDKL
jgi:hypothetical protein